ncbi:hypothetical protein [Streptomyces agglomeratus]|uniref:hypothetical protein n=1 Tax=Streptomyces agglomeratus TaxID=285458 RepID=UPI00114CC101|nr:hypothetical protein [Streptomyces agglomeratus]
MGIQRLRTDGRPAPDKAGTDGTDRADGTERTDGADKGEAPRNPRLDLSVAQVAGSAVAAVVAAVLASKLGVYGTIIGAGVVSVVATSGGTVFQHLFRRTGEQLREVTVHARPGVPARRPAGRQVPRTVTAATDPPNQEFGEATTHGTRVRGWRRSVVAAVVVFVVAMGGISAYELLSGGDLSGGRGSTVGNVFRGGEQHRRDTSPVEAPTPPADTPGGAGSPSPDAGTPAGRSPGPGSEPGTGTGTGTADARDSPEPGRTSPPKTPPATPDGGGTAGAETPAPTPTPSGGTVPGTGDGDAGEAPETGAPPAGTPAP